MRLCMCVCMCICMYVCMYVRKKSTHTLIGNKSSNVCSAICKSSVQVTSKAECYDIGRKEGNVLFNDALNTFDLRLYGVGHGKGPLR